MLFAIAFFRAFPSTRIPWLMLILTTELILTLPPLPVLDSSSTTDTMYDMSTRTWCSVGCVWWLGFKCLGFKFVVFGALVLGDQCVGIKVFFFLVCVLSCLRGLFAFEM